MGYDKSWNRRKFLKSIPAALGAPYLFTRQAKSKGKTTAPLPHNGSVEELLEKIPEPVIPGRPDLVEMYKKCWEIGYEHSEHGSDKNNFVDWYVDEGFDARIFQWDTSFSLAWAKYSQGGMPNIESHDNFYRNQHDDGAIGGVIRKNAVDNKPTSSPSFTHNNLFSWAEWEYYLVTGDSSRFEDLLPVLDKYADWTRKHRRHDDGHYWWSGFGSGMDNSPRSKPNKAYPPHGWVDYNANEALAAHYLAKMAEVVGNEQIAQKYRRHHQELKELVNNDMWSEEDRFYWDTDKDGSFMKVKTIASFWPMWGRITDPKHVDGLVDHLNDTDSFNRPHRVPTTAADEDTYVPSGGYWRGAIWAPTNHMVVKGLQANDRHKVARDIVLNHLNNMAAVFQGTETVWENYAPEYTKPGKPAKGDFVGWSADGPIAQLIENYIGININAPENSIRWNLLSTEKLGLRNIKLGDSTVDLVADERKKSDAPITVSAQTDKAFTLTLFDGNRSWERQITPDYEEYTFE